ncbi:uncharacterized protein LOC117647474 [Thrips palmi]|uniref:Uncharacterized protein LOC117647474 n=1 Tax=Thrips palmi TaxID=161013 RepID=A0A6P8YY90_THRPL|nr:uncharacterized protein LOC117647474 [Thrips palmi]XP_034245117.1 uncharacterized protein LOC117647474 [Thrips palmi]XP_034245118.1 uncharacterized protein LOC117647474 [Thrips palmi]
MAGQRMLQDDGFASVVKRLSFGSSPNREDPSEEDSEIEPTPTPNATKEGRKRPAAPSLLSDESSSKKGRVDQRKRKLTSPLPVVTIKRGRSSSVLVKPTNEEGLGTNWRKHVKASTQTDTTRETRENIQIEVITNEAEFHSPAKWNVRVSSDIPNSPIIVISSPATSGNWQVIDDKSEDGEAEGSDGDDILFSHNGLDNGNEISFVNDADPDDSLLDQLNNSNLSGASTQRRDPKVRMVYSNDSIQTDFFIDDEESDEDDPTPDEQENPTPDEQEVPTPDEQEEVPLEENRAKKRTRNDIPRDNTRKRLTHESRWKRTMRKEGFNNGSAYITSRGIEKPAREIKPPCSEKCNRCGRRLTERERKDIFDNFWALESIDKKRDYIGRLIDEKVPATCSTSPECARKTIRSYHFVVDDEEIRVCKTMFINTLGVQDTWVETALKKIGPNGLISDQRGKHQNRPSKVTEETIESVCQHINLFPRVASHYTRERSKREYLETHVHSIQRMYKLYKEWAAENNVKVPASLPTYRLIFNTRFNLGFFLPKKDQCELCAKWKKSTPEERKNIVREYAVHLENKKDVRRMHYRDLARVSDKICFACFDLQKVLICPRSEVSAFFYRNKLSMYNFTIYDTRLHEGHCNLWTEVDARKGSNEVGTCVLKFIETKVSEGIKEFIFESDGPTSQNRNRMVFNMYLTAAAKFEIKITHRFLESGHSYSEADSMHALIEKEAKIVQEIFSPEEWATLMRKAKQEDPPYIVKYLKNDEVLELHELPEQKENWERDSQNKKILWSRVRELVFDGNTPNIILFRYNFKDEMSKVHIKLNEGGETDRKNHEFAPAYNGLFPVSAITKKHLGELMKSLAIPSKYHPLYQHYISIGTEQ